jgi:hypothetical protein
MPLIEVRESVNSSAKGFVGNWSYNGVVVLAAVPRKGDFLVVGDDSAQVKDVYWYPGGKVSVTLLPVKTDSPDIVKQHDALRLKAGWTRSAGPWNWPEGKPLK